MIFVPVWQCFDKINILNASNSIKKCRYQNYNGKSWSPSHFSNCPIHFGQIGDAKASFLSDLCCFFVFSALISPQAKSQSTRCPLAPALLLGITYSAIIFWCGNQPSLMVTTGRLRGAACHSTQWQEKNVFSSLHVSIRSVSEVYCSKEKH